MKLSTIYISVATLFSTDISSKYSIFARGKHLKSKPVKKKNDRKSTPQARDFHQKAHTTLSNLKGSSPLTQDEAVFFDSSFVSAYERFNRDDDKHIVDARIIKKKKIKKPKKGGNKNRSLRYVPPYYVTTGYYYDFTIFMTWNCRWCYDSIWDRRTKKSAAFDQESFELVLCNMLRAGPYKVFRDVTDCRVAFE